MIAYFASDGSYGDADQLVIVDTSKWDDSRWEAIQNATDNDRIKVAREQEPTVIWQSIITEKMIRNIKNDELGILINALDDAVMDICNDWGINL
jgi:hypothetical protein